MSVSILLAAFTFSPLFHREALAGNMFWEEEVMMQKIPGYHPVLRFNPGNTYMFVTPFYIQQGKYTVRNNQYEFKAITAYELENAEKFKLQAEMNPEEAHKFDKAYTLSMKDFTAEYNEQNATLYVTCFEKDIYKTFKLYALSDGDARRDNLLHGVDRGLAGIWHAPDPFPERMNCRERFKFFGLEGLQQFAKEAMSADGAQMAVMDLRTDRTYRFHDKTGMWKRDGSLLILMTETADMKFQISDDGSKLLTGGKVAFTKI